MEIVGNDAQFNEKVTLLKDLEIYGNIKNKTKDTSFDFSDNLSFKIQGKEKLRITSDNTTFTDTVIASLVSPTNVSVAQSVTANEYYGTFKGSIDPAVADDKISEGNSSAEVVDTGSNGHFKVITEGTERLRITSQGNIGISSVIPDSKLEVTGIDPAMTVHHPTQSRGGIVGLSTQRVAFFSTIANDDLVFGFSDNPPSSDNFVEHMRIDNSTGRVGINSSIPAATLDIHDVGSTGPNLLLRGGSQTEGDIVVPDGEALQIGHWNYGSNTFSERYRMKSNGHLFINTTVNPLTNAEALINMRVDDGEDGVNIRHDMSGHCINIWRSNGNGSALEFYRSNGSQGSSVGRINLTTTSTAYATSSDYRLKENAVGITSAITRLKTLKPYRFNFINEPTKTVDGFFAHEVTAVPEAITGTKDEVDSDNNPVYQGIDQSKLVPLLTAALQEAVAKIETLEAKVAALESA